MACEVNYEIERRFLIRMPDKAALSDCISFRDISQTYLVAEKGNTARVRCSAYAGISTYTHTVKRRISAIRREEDEREISLEEYQALLLGADPQRHTIEKRRYIFDYKQQCFEIDVFPFYPDRAIMEIELENEGQSIIFPPQFEIIKEVTEDKRYTNASMALSVPYDNI